LILVEEALEGVVPGRAVSGAVLPAVPDDEEPGAGEDADGVGVVEWAQAIDGALGDAAQTPSPGADPFSLVDAEATARLLEYTGFDGLRFEDVREPVFYGHDIDDALEIVRGFQDTSAALATLNGDETDRAACPARA